MCSSNTSVGWFSFSVLILFSVLEYTLLQKLPNIPVSDFLGELCS